MKTFKLKLFVGYQCEVEEEITLDDLGYEEEEWEDFTVKEQNQILDQYADEWSRMHVEVQCYES